MNFVVGRVCFLSLRCFMHFVTPLQMDYSLCAEYRISDSLLMTTDVGKQPGSCVVAR